MKLIVSGLCFMTVATRYGPERGFENMWHHSVHWRTGRIAAIIVLVLAGNGRVLGDEIHEAAKNGDIATMRVLLQGKHSPVENKDSYGETALHLAVDNGHKDIVELLLAKGANVNAPGKSGETPLHLAALRGQGGIAEVLLASGANSLW